MRSPRAAATAEGTTHQEARLMSTPSLQQEVHGQIGRCVNGLPWVLEVTTGKVISIEERLHGVQILAVEALKITERLARDRRASRC